MRRVTAELREIAEAIETHSCGGLSVCGDRMPAEEKDPAILTTHVANALYQRLYCRPQPAGSGPRPDGRATRVFMEALSEANSGKGTWEPGWIVQAVEDDGTLVVHKRQDDLTVWARPEQFRPIHHAPVAAGCSGRLRLGKELREMLPGYYTILGDADQPDGDPGIPASLIRFYWHLTAEGACPWVRELTRRFNGAGVAFHAKLLGDPATYARADAGVLYVARAELPGVMALLPDLHAAIAPQLRAVTPMFTRPLAPGLAVAEDPGDGQSFGLHRCRLAAEALLRARAAGRTSPGNMAAAIAARFAEEGLDSAHPWLGPGSTEDYAWPEDRRPARRSTGT